MRMTTVLTVLLWAFLTACNDGAGEDSRLERRDSPPLPEGVLSVETRGRPGGILRYPLRREPATFNWVAANDTRSFLVSQLFTATLLEMDRGTQQVVPGVIESWAFAEGGLTVDLKLRKGIRFGDGSPLMAEDVLFSLEHVLHPEASNRIKDSLLFEGQSLHFEVVDDATVRIYLAKPDASLEYFLTFIPALPRHRFVGARGGIEDYWTLETPPHEIVGAGPFYLAEHVPGQRTVLKRNRHYWKVDSKGRRLPYLDAVEVVYIPSVSQQALRLRTGDIHLIDQALSPELYEDLAAQASDVRAIDAGPSTELLLFWFNLNLDREPPEGSPYLTPAKKSWFGDADFRRAIDALIDRSEIAQVAYLGHAKPAAGFVPESDRIWHDPSLELHSQNVDKARDLLSDAGYTWKRRNGRETLLDPQGHPVRFELIALDTAGVVNTATMIQQDLRELGIEVTLRQEELRSLGSRVAGSRLYDAVVATFSFPNEPSAMSNVLLSSAQMHLWSPAQSQPHSEWERRIDHLLSRQRSLFDLEERREDFWEVQRIVAHHAPLLPLVHIDMLVAARKSLKNLHPANPYPGGTWNAWELYFER